MTKSSFNLDSSSWRLIDVNRPWYAKALQLLPDSTDYSIIELGSGHGELAQKLQPLVKKLTCVDRSEIYVNQLTRSGFKAVLADFNQPLSFKTGQFDGAISLEVIEHLVDAEGFLKEVYRLLKPQGWLIISTPNIAWWGYRLFCLLGQPPKKEGYHLRYFTHHTLIDKLNQAGFKMVRSASFTTIPLLNRLLFKFKLKPIHPRIKYWPNLLAQDLVFLCQKK